MDGRDICCGDNRAMFVVGTLIAGDGRKGEKKSAKCATSLEYRVWLSDNSATARCFCGVRRDASRTRALIETA